MSYPFLYSNSVSSKESGIDGGVFVHISGFIGGNKTLEGALAMAKKALQMGAGNTNATTDTNKRQKQ